MNDKIELALASIGFSEEEARKQLKELEKLIADTVTLELAKKHPEACVAGEFDDKFISTLPKGEFENTTFEVTVRVSMNYLEAITKNLSDKQKLNFFKTAL